MRWRGFVPPLVWGILAMAGGPGAAEARQPTAAGQREEILSYDVTIRVEADGAMEVTEEIRVRTLGDQLGRVISRDFSAAFLEEGGSANRWPPVEVIRVRRDGVPEPYVLARGRGSGSGVRLRMGTPGQPFVPGEHTYTLTYRAEGWFDIEDDRAVLRWDVVGMGWWVPIRRASARIRLPERVAADEVVLGGPPGPRGPWGARVAAAFDADADSGSVAVFRTERPLRPAEPMPIRLDVPAPTLSALMPERQAPWVSLAWRPFTDTAVVLLAILAFYLLVWAVDGRDPPKRPVVVQYEPPDGLSPAAVGYLDRRGYDPSQMTAAILSLARQGVLEIDEKDREWTLRRTGPVPPDITPDERGVVEALLPEPDALVILGISQRRVGAARKALRKELARRYRTPYFTRNLPWVVLGLLLSLVGFAGLAWQTRFVVGPRVWVLVVALLVWSTLMGRVLTRGYHLWRIELAEGIPRPSLLAASIFPLLSLVPLAVLAAMAYALYQVVSPHLLVAVLALCGINAVFYHLLARPTAAGREVLDRVEGFKRFLAATEADRIERLSSEESRDLFERFLPYAVALGMKNRWVAVFGGAMQPVIPGEG